MDPKSIKIVPTHFAVVATTEGLWRAGTNLGEVLARIRKQAPARKGKPVPLVVFASTAPMDLEFDIYVRAYSQPGHPLIQFDI